MTSRTHRPTNRLYENDPKSNMYGCLPCPKCGSLYRYPFVNSDGRKVIICNDCSPCFEELLDEGETALP